MDSFGGKIWGVVFSVSLLFGCGGGKLSPSDLKKYVENPENGFVQVVNTGTYRISCMWEPAEYVAVNYFRSDKIKKEEFEPKRKAYSDFELYRLEIRSSDPKNMKSLTEYFSFYMQDDIRMVLGGDTVSCEVYHAEPFNAISGTQNIEFGFSSVKGSPREILFLDTPLFGNAEDFVFVFDIENIKVPEVRLY